MEEAEDLEDLGAVEDVGLENDDGTNGSPVAEDPQEKTTIGLAGYSADVDSRILPFVGQVLSAMVLMIALTTNDVARLSGNYGYGLSVAILAMVAGLGGIVLVTKPDLYDSPIGTLPVVGPVTIGRGLAQFLFFWWFVGACVLTFSGPFLVTSNGYFASWAGVVCSLVALGVTRESIMSSSVDLGYSNGLLGASIIQICAVARELGPGQGEAVYSLVVCILTVLAILALQTPGTEKYAFPSYVLFSVLWVVLACLVTFRGPFVLTGNGYFSAWLGCVTCVFGALALSNKQ